MPKKMTAQQQRVYAARRSWDAHRLPDGTYDETRLAGPRKGGQTTLARHGTSHLYKIAVTRGKKANATAFGDASRTPAAASSQPTTPRAASLSGASPTAVAREPSPAATTIAAASAAEKETASAERAGCGNEILGAEHDPSCANNVGSLGNSDSPFEGVGDANPPGLRGAI